ncbi:hypothetical protein Tsubulata_021101 [Turnera subulata]|uniref:J domain-containing protein n=1 Tax=Turnera subulata TaxID=218843 RepID=A0A9Q0GJ43_9ROSI|nr:hypothetical protein Tsubulata_021101 [Turnera subulata]
MAKTLFPQLPQPYSLCCSSLIPDHMTTTTSFVDHYTVLRLPSGEEGERLTEREITRAYKLKALELHPDKRPCDPNAHANFLKLRSSYDTLMDPVARKNFDDYTRVKRMTEMQNKLMNGWITKMANEVAREAVRKQEEAEAKRQAEAKKQEAEAKRRSLRKIFVVSWDKVRKDYSAEELRKFLSRFGVVEDIDIARLCRRNRRSAKVSMVVADYCLIYARFEARRLPNPLLVRQRKPIEGAKLTVGEIARAFKLKALELHPDKKPEDPNAHVDFEKLWSSFETLIDPVTRKEYDAYMRVKRLWVRPQYNSKEWMDKLVKALIPVVKSRLAAEEAEEAKRRKEEAKARRIPKRKILAVSWEEARKDYSEEELREFLSRFGEVEDIDIAGFCRNNRKTAKVSMVDADSALAGARVEARNLPNPLCFRQLKPTV